MATFMLLLFDDPTEYSEMSPSQLQDLLARYMAWNQKMRGSGKVVGGHKLREEGGRNLKSEAGKVVVRDGPYAELREVIGGYFILDAADYNEAVEIASSCPHATSRGSMQLREIQVMGPPKS